jgi:polyhydroxyalkanoate synthesis regulator phasin
MTKQEIEKKLRDSWVFKGTGQMNYEEAKRVVTGDLLKMTDPKEYESRIKVICEYLNI